MHKICIIDLELSNLMKVYNAFYENNINVDIVKPNENISSYDVVVLPGTGSFHKAMYRINKSKFQKKILNHLNSGKKIIGICLGMQLLFSDSKEIIYEKGLDIFKGHVVSLRDKIDKFAKVPCVGKYEVFLKSQNLKLSSINNLKMFFNNSFIVETNENFEKMLFKYDKQEFLAAIFSKKILGTQFHPELSGNKNSKIFFKFIKSWIQN